MSRIIDDGVAPVKSSRQVVRPRILDLFCGAGGAAVGYHRAGFDVVGIDIEQQPHYPFEFMQDDAIAFLYYTKGVGCDAIHASPPCQAYSEMHGSSGPQLIEPTRRLLEQTGLPYIIENVPGAPLRSPTMLCGSMFDLDVERHRIFESNWPLGTHDWPCRHQIWAPRYDVYDHGKHYKARTVPVYGTGGGKAVEHWADAMGIDWMTRAELAEAIPPAYTEWIGARLLEYITGRVAA
jgi:DNA (cytosine-5)-methyltransferase 1